MKKYICCFWLFTCIYACETKKINMVPPPDDIDLNELALASDFAYTIPKAEFSSKEATFNTVRATDGSWTGFCYSNMNYRSYSFTDTGVDSMTYSVYTSGVNATKGFAIANAKGQDAFIRFNKPCKVAHLLLANTTQLYLAMTYGGSWYLSNTKPATAVANPNIPSAKTGIFNAYLPNGSLSQRLNAAASFFKVMIKGYKGNSETGTVTAFLACRTGGNPAMPAWNFGIRPEWFPTDLSSLGEVDKLVFTTASSAVVSGVDVMPPMFCVDGIKIIP